MKLISIEKNLFKNKVSAGLILFLSVLVVCCLILLFGINEAGKREIVKDIKEKGNVNIVNLDQRVFTEKGFDEEPKAILSPCDLQLIKNSCHQVKDIGFYAVTYIQGEMKIGDKQYSAIQEIGKPVLPNILGATPDCIKVLELKIKEGRFINNTDMRYKRRVCVLGGEALKFITQKKVIGTELITKNPDGKFTIVGVLHKKMPLFTSLPDGWRKKLLVNSDPYDVKAGRKFHSLAINDNIYIPYTTWQDFVKGRDISTISIGGITLECETMNKYLFSSDTFPPNTWLWLKIDASFEGKGEGKFIKGKEDLRVFKKFCSPLPESLKEPLEGIRKVLRKKYGEDTFFCFESLGSLNDELNDQIEDSNKLLGITALFSLLLSGILLTSMMLMLVHKRVSEIGIRRAFGARRRDIFWQFLSEGVTLYSLGIAIGIVIGSLISYLMITKIFSWEFSIPFYGIVISSLFVFFVGILSSLYPAMKAANIPPAQAVKYE